jgi:cytochrome c5
MTNAITRSRVSAAKLERIAADLAEAHADLDLLERLKSAHDRVTRLTAEHEKVTKERDKTLAAEAKAAEASRYADIGDVLVTCNTPSEHVVRASFTITYTKMTWDGRQSRLMEHARNGFSALPPDVLGYLMDKRPDRIPAKIMDLAPGDPKAAFRRYFASLRLGRIAA